MEITRKKFNEIFSEDKNEKLSLKIKIKLGEDVFEEGTCAEVSQDIGGIDFHKYRYFDFAGEVLDDGTFEIKGVFSNDQ